MGRPWLNILTLAIAGLVVSCSGAQTPVGSSQDVSEVHNPPDILDLADLQEYVLAYCWRSLTGGTPGGTHTNIIVSRGNGDSPNIITSPRPSRFSAVNLGCFGLEESLFRGGHPLAWRPGHAQLTMALGPADLPDSFYFVDIDAQGGLVVHRPGQIIEGIRDYLDGPYYELEWSPDGDWLATRGLGVDVPGLEDVWLYNPDTNQIKQVTDLSKSHDPVKRLGWAASGKYLAMSYSLSLAGVGITRLDDMSYISVSNETQAALRNWSQKWSDPTFRFQAQLDGSSRPVWIDQDQRVVFTAPATDGRVTLFVVNADGSDLRELLIGLPGLVNLPTLSADGSKLAFVRFPEWAEVPDRAEIAVVDLKTMDLASLILIPAPPNGDMLYISGLDWTPDGKYLAFSSDHGGQSDVYVISADGQAWVNLTEDLDGDAVNPIWHP